jgi:hypothetical protein
MFFSKPIAARHSKLVVYEHELIGLVHVVRHWRAYLWGCLFIIKTDYYSPKFLLDQRLSTIPQHQWTSKLLSFDFHVEFKPGVANVVVDTLSHRDTEGMGEGMALYRVTFKLFNDLHHEFDDDHGLCALRDDPAAGN